jgi:hypothetical protein
VDVLSARSRFADADLTARYEALAVRIGHAENEVERYRHFLYKLRNLLEEFDRAELLRSEVGAG